MGCVVLRRLPVALRADHPVRADVLDVPVYHNSLGHAAAAVNAALAGYNFELDSDDTMALTGDSGYATLAVLDSFAGPGEPVGFVSFSWYTLRAGRVELTVYVA